ncbi:MAG: hypothetical protein WKF58_04890 [Ilumatobacteraceae bacterium]
MLTVTGRPLEADCEDTIIEAARTLGYLVHAERPARSGRGWRTAIKGDAGFPDLVIAGHGRCFVVELKRHPRKATDEQLAWLTALRVAGVSGGIVYVPDEQQAFIDELARGASRMAS